MEPGQLIGPYRLENLIAEGGMGSVWRARHPTLDRLVAIKFVKTEVRDNTHARDAFMREVRHLSRLHGPQIVHVLDFGFTDEGDPYMVTEFLEGEDLLALLRRNGKTSVREAVFIGIEVLKALGEAHALGLVHRDLKPGNIFLQRLAGGARMAVKVLDFGVAKLLASDEGEGTLWPDGSPKGSPRYMAPEQVLNEPVTPASDMYAFGATLYRALSGEPVFGGSVHVMMRAHLEGQAESLRSRFPSLGIPAELDDIIIGCLAKNPVDRPGSADALQARLEKLLQTLAGGSGTTGSPRAGPPGASPDWGRPGRGLGAGPRTV
jgi:serine/threonine protein kinase